MDTTHSHLHTFFGLREQPFAPTADPTYFYATNEHKSCLFRLWGSIDERHGIAVVLGNYGTGKTTLLRKLMTGMAADPERYNTAVLGSPIPSWTSFALLEAIIKQFGLRPEERTFVSYMEALNRHLLVNRGRISTLIIDDAQNLNKRGQLELLRLAQNLETPQRKLLNLVLFAQLEWTRVLEAAPNFAQRINMTYTLAPLGRAEAAQFIDFRLKRAGASPEGPGIFSDAAVEMIHVYSEGNPRLIVTLGRNALLLAAQLKKHQIDQDLILHTIEKTTLPNVETRQRVNTVLRAFPPREQAPTLNDLAEAPVIQGSPFTSAAHRRGNGHSHRANQLLLRAARAKQNP